MSYIAPTADPSELYFEPPSGYVAPTSSVTEIYFDLSLEIDHHGYEGSVLEVSLTVAPRLLFGGDLGFGSISSAPISGALASSDTSTIQGNAHEGSSFVVDLQITNHLSASGYTGETALADVSAAIRLSSESFTGESFEVDLVLRAPVTLEPRGYTGESGIFTLATSANLITNAHSGETLVAALTDYPNPGMPASAHTGESAEASLQVTPGFILPAFTGETSAAELSTSAALSLQGADGSTLFCELGARPAANLEANGRTGESLNVLLNSAGDRLFPIGHTGESLSATFTSYPAAEILAQANTGETFGVSIAFAQQLGIFNGYEGSSVVFATLGEDPITRAYDGGYAVASLAVDVTLPMSFFEGAVGGSTLKTGPSEGIGSLRCDTGENFVTDALKIAVSAQLRVLFRNSYVARLDIDSETDFDLISDAGCCGPQDDGTGERIDLGDAPLPGWTWSGYKQIFEVDLSTRPRFSLRAYEGTEFTLKDYSAYLTLDFADGSAAKVEAFDALINIRLCRPNFIPDGDSIITELDTLYDENCASDWARTGETMNASLSSVQGPLPRMYVGETMHFVMNIPERWTLLAYTGEHAYVNNPEFSPRFPTGEALIPKLYEDAFLAYEGTTLGNLNLVTEYAVEFLEVGCFENEFIPLNENGDPVPDLFNEVPVELDFYQHEIKARCF